MIVKDIKNAKILGSDISKIIFNGDLVWSKDAYFVNELDSAAMKLDLKYSYEIANGTKIYNIYSGSTLQLPDKIQGHETVNISWRSSNTKVVAYNWRVVGTSRQNCYLIATLMMQGTSLTKEVSFFCRVK